MIAARKPRSDRLLDRCVNGRRERFFLLGVATRRWTGTGPSRPTDEPLNHDSGRRRAFRYRTDCSQLGRRRLPTRVPLTIPTGSAGTSASTSSRTRPRSALRSGTAVPSQSNTAASDRRSSTMGNTWPLTAVAGCQPSSSPRQERRVSSSGRRRAGSRRRPRSRRCGWGSTSAGARRSPSAATSE